jgi:drug/metabolite transporter (DMT)-like permease
MILGFAGIIILQSKGQLSNLKFDQSYYGLLMGIACGMSYGYYSAKSSQVHKSDLPSFLFTGSFISSIVMILYVLLTNDINDLSISLYELLLAFFVGFFFESLGYLFWTRAQTLAVEEKADITKIVSLANYLPLFSILLLGVVYNDERMIITEGYFLVSVFLIVGSSLLPVVIRDK